MATLGLIVTNVSNFWVKPHIVILIDTVSIILLSPQSE